MDPTRWERCINRDLPFAELDTLYAYILSSCTQDCNLVLHILGVYNGVNHLLNRVNIIEFALGLEDGDVCIYLGPLSSLLKVHSEGILFHHSSFMDFLLSPERSKSYHIDPSLSSSLVAQRILEVFPSIGVFPQSSVNSISLRVAINKTFLGPSSCQHGKPWLDSISVCSFLEDSSWTPRLECAVQRFSTSAYLNWFDDHVEKIWCRWDPQESFPARFLNYLKVIVSNPWRETNCQLQLLILIRENLTFITIIPCVIWNTPYLPSTIPPLERNSLPWPLFGLSSRNPSHRYRGVLRLQGGMDYVPLYLGSTPKRSFGIGIVTSLCVTQQSMMMIYLSTPCHGLES